MHINLPFASDAEFGRLHAAVRLVLPILPAMAASSPYAGGRAAGALDYRLDAYRGNARGFTCITGQVVPDTVSSRDEYEETLLRPMYGAIEPHDPEGVLRHEWLNSRGAIARFDRNAIEIRVVDVQECVSGDVALAALIVDFVQMLYEERTCSWKAQQEIPTSALADVFLACIRDAERARIVSREYLRLLGVGDQECEAAALWRRLGTRLAQAGSPHADLWCPYLAFVLRRGTLARRLTQACGPAPTRSGLERAYAQLCDCLEGDQLFAP